MACFLEEYPGLPAETTLTEKTIAPTNPKIIYFLIFLFLFLFLTFFLLIILFLPRRLLVFGADQDVF